MHVPRNNVAKVIKDMLDQEVEEGNEVDVEESFDDGGSDCKNEHILMPFYSLCINDFCI